MFIFVLTLHARNIVRTHISFIKPRAMFYGCRFSVKMSVFIDDLAMAVSCGLTERQKRERRLLGDQDKAMVKINDMIY